MNIIAKCKVELGDHICQRGEKVAYNGEITSRIAANFTDEAGGPLVVESTARGGAAATGDGASGGPAPLPKETAENVIAKTVAVMGRQGIMQALDGMNITYSPKSRTEYLAKLLLQNRGEIEC